MTQVWGGVEGGGTKFVCLLGSGPDDVLATETIPTTTPDETLGRVADFFARAVGDHTLAALGVASFGPLDLDPASPTYGAITTTPKPGWAGADVVGLLRRRLGVPVAWDTDVNGAALGELRWGAARGLRTAVYYTVGTGIGGGAVVDGRPLHGLLHPEMGHIPIAALADPARSGVCPYHGGGCLEGVASGPALHARAGQPPETLAPDDPIWEDEARYLAFAAAVATLMLSPQRIIFGGGVLRQRHLFPRIHAHFLALLGGYVRSPAVTGHVAEYIVPPLLGERAGPLGALALALDAAPGA
jgi:fructokinase